MKGKFRFRSSPLRSENSLRSKLEKSIRNRWNSTESPKEKNSNASRTTGGKLFGNGRKVFHVRVPLILAAGAGAAISYWFLNNDENWVAKALDLFGSESDSQTKKEKLVILGSGWGALSLLKQVDTNLYDVSIVSPRNYFLFTPLLPSTAVGTIDCRSITEPIRNFCARNKKNVNFLEAECTDIDFQKKIISCKDVSPVVGELSEFTVPYDKLVVAVGAINNTFGTPGVHKNAHFMKQVEDSLAVRTKVIDLFESASLPGQSELEKKRLLHFVICGGGPTGVEFAAELSDLITEDLNKLYPSVSKYVSLTMIQSGEHVLNTYDQAISEYTEKHFKRENIELMLNTRVLEVKEKALTIVDKVTGVKIEMPMGLCIWSTGNAPTTLGNKIKTKIPEQTNKVALVTDDFLELKGAPGVYALGDCATVEQKRILDKFEHLFKEADVNNDGVLTFKEFRDMILKVSSQYKQIAFYGRKLDEMFEFADENKDKSLSLNEFKKLLKDIDSTIKAYPATAQCARQQGTYLGDLLNKKAKEENPIIDPFKYAHQGSFAYVGGNVAVIELSGFKIPDFASWVVWREIRRKEKQSENLDSWKISGFSAWLLWRGAYWGMQQSLKNKFSIAGDWTKTYFFGRDTSRY